MTLSYGSGEERDKEAWRRQGVRNFSRRSLLSFILKCFPLSGIFRLSIIVAPLMQNRELKP